MDEHTTSNHIHGDRADSNCIPRAGGSEARHPVKGTEVWLVLFMCTVIKDTLQGQAAARGFLLLTQKIDSASLQSPCAPGDGERPPQQVLEEAG